MTPLLNLPYGAGQEQKRAIYDQRYAEKIVLKKLKAELEAPAPDRMAAIADAVNGARIR